ncbi:MAG: aminotransferase class V-fold PLP-dependent enzyme, partial [Gammaproteobacteria bacterium]|nr:aminotransferase class V-fold PLP-dependent enzyme [Gammaproteobacteria bacterium]
RLPNTTFFALPFYHGETLLMELDKSGFALASGSACHSEVTQPSHVLKAMQIEDNIAQNEVRVSMGFDNTLQQVDALINKLAQLVNKLPAIIRQAAV